MHVRTPDLLLRCMQHRETPEPVIELADVTVAFGDNLVLDGLNLVIRPRAVTVTVGRSGSGKTVLLTFGDNHVLRGVSLSIRPHGITVLIGASGSGKSVIAKHLMGLLRPDGGRIVVFGSDLAPLGERELLELRHRFGLVFQHAGLLDWLSVEGNVGFPLREHAIGRAETHRRVSEMLELLELTPLAKRLPGDLSAGERKRVGIARAMVGHPEIVFPSGIEIPAALPMTSISRSRPASSSARSPPSSEVGATPCAAAANASSTSAACLGVVMRHLGCRRWSCRASGVRRSTPRWSA